MDRTARKAPAVRCGGSGRAKRGGVLPPVKGGRGLRPPGPLRGRPLAALAAALRQPRRQGCAALSGQRF